MDKAKTRTYRCECGKERVTDKGTEKPRVKCSCKKMMKMVLPHDRKAMLGLQGLNAEDFIFQ